MQEVWLVIVEGGMYSDIRYAIDGAYATEGAAVSRVVKELGALLSDEYSRGHLAWVIDYEYAERRFGGRLVDGEYIPLAPDAPDWWEDGGLMEPIVCKVRRVAVER